MSKFDERISQLKPPVELQEVKFPGHEFFDSKQQVSLATTIRDLTELEVETVREVMKRSGIPGWDERGFPNTKGISLVEQIVRRRGFTLIVADVARMLNKRLTIDDLRYIVDAEIYEQVPQRALVYLQKDRD